MILIIIMMMMVIMIIILISVAATLNNFVGVGAAVLWTAQVQL